jgi:hypothetical protein
MTVAVRNVEPSEMALWPPPEGWQVLWQADERCRPATVGEHANRICRRPRCDGKPVMALERKNGWVLFCAEHLYGRRIVDGVVESRVVRKVDE